VEFVTCTLRMRRDLELWDDYEWLKRPGSVDIRAFSPSQ
jgi:hypothetical protein